MNKGDADSIYWFPHTKELFEPLGCVDARRRGPWVFVSAQAGIDEQLQALDGLEAQTIRAFENLKAALNQVGGTVDQVCSLNIYVNTGLLKTSFEEAALTISECQKVVLGEKATTACLVGAQMFGIPSLLIEIQCIGRAQYI